MRASSSPADASPSGWTCASTLTGAGLQCPDHSCRTLHMPSIKWPLTALLLAICASSSAFDLETFRSLDPSQLREAEARMSEFLEPGTARLLREPRNASERYLFQRQQRQAAAFNRRAVPVSQGNGEKAQAMFWPAARASRVRIGPDGRAHIQCQPAQVLIGRTPPDFRSGNPAPRPVR